MVPGNMNLYNSNINMKNKDGERFNNRQNVHTNGPTQMSHVQQMGDTHHKKQYNSNVQLDRNNPEILNAFKSNPFTHSLTHVP
jgi:ribosome-associated toxin RatA of RatAB toxin-antitoxin module